MQSEDTKNTIQIQTEQEAESMSEDALQLLLKDRIKQFVLVLQEINKKKRLISPNKYAETPNNGNKDNSSKTN